MEGEFQDWFSFEIVSLDGYVQYIIRAPAAWRDLVEAAVYAQYPDAEISEVTDYTQDIPSQWPNEKWEFFGTGYKLDKPEAYPIKTYNEFEDKIRGEFIDPMSPMLEIMSKINKGEQIWYQILAKPIVDVDWLPAAQAEIDKVVDRKPKEKWTLKGVLLNIPHAITGIIDSVTGSEFVQTAAKGDDENSIAKSPMFRLTPGERTVLEDMERKTSKLAFKCRIRIAYFGKKNIFSKARGVAPVVGAIKQFNDTGKNWLKVEKKSWTKANYFFKKARTYQRQESFYDAFASRSTYAGDASGGFVLNSEELATIYHFPMMSVRAPLVKRTGAKKSEPPTTLPIGESGGSSYILPEAPEPPGAVLESVLPSSEEEAGPGPIPGMSKSNTVDMSQVKYIEIPDEPQPEADPPLAEESSSPPEPPPNLPV